MKQTVALPKLEFVPITPDLRRRYTAITANTCRDADHAFVNLYIWNETYHQEIAFAETAEGERAVIRFFDGNALRHHLSYERDNRNQQSNTDENNHKADDGVDCRFA